MWRPWWTKAYTQMAIAYGWYYYEYDSKEPGVDVESTVSSLSASALLWGPHIVMRSFALAAAPYAAGYALGAAVGVLALRYGPGGSPEAAAIGTEFYLGHGNYYSGDPNDSGYFNIYDNIKTVLTGTDFTHSGGSARAEYEESKYYTTPAISW